MRNYKNECEKIITTTESIDLNINGITLLSTEEAIKLPINIRISEYPWWLRSPGEYDTYAAIVSVDGEDVFSDGISVDEEFGVRPALKISNLESCNLQIGDIIIMFNYTWTVISNNLILCDKIVGKCKFRENWKAKDANNYEASDVKKWLEKWYIDQCHANGSDDNEITLELKPRTTYKGNPLGYASNGFVYC